ncbi:MAG: hypothetical protein J5714_00975 [Alphaproteobacteria bacterium]|nr:hypothetical protein [Alphaproteobacteria bacterium]
MYYYRAEMGELYDSPYKSELIQMYAALKLYPVRISYPEGQPSNHPKTKEERWKLDNWKWNNNFTTIYNIGPCKIEHYDPKKLYMEVPATQELRFYTPSKPFDFASLHYYHEKDEIKDQDKIPLMQLYQNTKHKLFGRPFTNPFDKYMQTHISELQSYAVGSLDEERAKSALIQLKLIESLLGLQKA